MWSAGREDPQNLATQKAIAIGTKNAANGFMRRTLEQVGVLVLPPQLLLLPKSLQHNYIKGNRH